MSLNLKLKLKKPLVFLKIATTGFEPVKNRDSDKPADKIVEISIIKIDAEREVQIATKLVNPGIPIPEEASLVNGITDADVAGAETFKEISSALYSFIGDADFAGFSLTNFDLKFLTEEFNNAGIEFTIVGRKIIDLNSIYHSMERRDFNAAIEKYTGKSLDDALIRSEQANIESVNIFNGMVDAYPEDKRFVNTNPDTLHDSFNRNKKALDVRGSIILNKEGRPVFNFGKYRNNLIGDMMIADPSYYDWCVNVSDMPGDTKLLLRKITEKAKESSKSQNA